MPFNVCAITCTVCSLFVCSIVELLVVRPGRVGLQGPSRDRFIVTAGKLLLRVLRGVAGVLGISLNWAWLCTAMPRVEKTTKKTATTFFDNKNFTTNWVP